MRLDKYLKSARLIKRRTLAKEFCDAGKATVNGRAAKASTEITPGDRLVLHFWNRTMVLEVLRLADNLPAAQAATLYTILEETRLTGSGSRNLPVDGE